MLFLQKSVGVTAAVRTTPPQRREFRAANDRVRRSRAGRLRRANLRRSELDRVAVGHGRARRSRREFVTFVIVTAVAAVSGPGAAVGASCWEPPVVASVSDPYRPPPCKWCPGNRGVEFDTGPGEPVRAVAAGTVTFAGPVAHTWFVVVRHVDGLRTTYGNVTDLAVSEGSVVVRGMRIATTAGRLHFGLRDGDEYLDPTPYLGEWVGRARLIPTDGTPPRPAPPPRLSCASG